MKKQVNFNYDIISKFNKLNDNELEIYIALKLLYNPNNEMCCVTLDDIYYILGFGFKLDANINREKIKVYKEAMQSLSNKGFITILAQDKRRYILDLSAMNEKCNNTLYVQLDMDRLSECINNSSIRIIRYLATILDLKRQNNNMYYFNMSREQLSYILDMNINTVDKYNKLLVKNKILFIYKSNHCYLENKQIINNAYGLYQDAEKIKELCDKYINDCLADGNIKEINVGRKQDDICPF